MGLQLKNLKKLKITVAQSPFQIGGEFINESGRINFLSLFRSVCRTATTCSFDFKLGFH